MSKPDVAVNLGQNLFTDCQPNSFAVGGYHWVGFIGGSGGVVFVEKRLTIFLGDAYSLVRYLDHQLLIVVRAFVFASDNNLSFSGVFVGVGQQIQ